MILRSIRLWNIKSYGDGAEGRGVTIAFAPGINRIAGRNGHGKSTLIEALGYALFFTKPVFEENFDAATYLLRAGKKEGEIDITFTHGGETYRVERGLGSQSRRRAKVVQCSDESIAAEGDDAVAGCLCRLFGLADAAQLTELFAKLAGVKQGRLTWPFDSKAAEARKHFEPLLDVEIFRQCFDRLKPVVDEYEELQRTEETKLATIEERIRERADSAVKLEAATKQAEGLEGKAKSAQEQKAKAAAFVAAQETKEKAQREAEQLRAEAVGRRDLAKHRHDTAAQRVRESRGAVEAVLKAKPAHDAYVAADEAARALQPRQEQRAKVREELAGQQRTLAQLEEQTAAARRRAAELAEDAKTKTTGAAKRREQLAKDREATDRDRALELEAEAAKQVEAVAARLTEKEQQRKTLSGQIQEIAGGFCPFLKEACRQFDQAKVQADLVAFDHALPPLRRELEAVRAAHKSSQVALRAWTTKRAQVEAEAKTLDTLAAEIAQLGERVARELAVAAQRATSGATATAAIERLQAAVNAFGDLDAESRRLQAAKDATSAGHRTYLAEKAKAEELAARETAMIEAKSALDAQEKAVVEAEAALAAARKDFDVTALATARKELEAATAAAATSVAQVASAKAELAREQKRLREHEAALKERAAHERELGDLSAAIALTQKARSLLQKAAPYVAQHICRRIASRAQQLFNRINHDPVELEWDAKQYSLRVHPGERRFAMLSGGEQTKLALAMTLTMIQDLSGLKFCVFDEPTYGVDADSRSLLADAIVEVQAAAGFDQLLLVSHDDAFDGKIEHTVVLKKTATGTQVESV